MNDASPISIVHPRLSVSLKWDPQEFLINSRPKPRAPTALVPSATAGSAGGGGDKANGIERLRELEAMFLGGPVNAIDSKLNEVRMLHFLKPKKYVRKTHASLYLALTLYS